MRKIETINAPSMILVEFKVTDAITSQTWTNNISTMTVDNAISFVKTDLTDIIANEDVPVATQQLKFSDWVALIFNATDAYTITQLYTTPSQMLAFMSYTSVEFNKYEQKVAEVKKSFEQQFSDTGALAGLNATENLYVNFYA